MACWAGQRASSEMSCSGCSEMLKLHLKKHFPSFLLSSFAVKEHMHYFIYIHHKKKYPCNVAYKVDLWPSLQLWLLAFNLTSKSV